MLYEKEERIIHHVHIPKCAGTSIESLLKSNGWQKVKKEVPGNLHCEVIGSPYTKHPHRNIWESWIEKPEFQFAIVRNPYSRFDSRLRQRYKNQYIQPEHILSFVSAVFNDRGAFYEGLYDNHFRPQVDFIGSESHAYSYESDLSSLVKDLVEREIISSSSSLSMNNVGDDQELKVPWHLPDFEELHEEFKHVYELDFKLFGYETKQF